MFHRFHLYEKTHPHWIGEFVQFPGHANPWRRWLLLFLGGPLESWWLWDPCTSFPAILDKCCVVFMMFPLFLWKLSPTVFWSVASSNTSPTSKYPGINVHSNILLSKLAWPFNSTTSPAKSGWFTKRELLWKHDFCGGQGDMFGRVKGSRAEIDGWNWFVA